MLRSRFTEEQIVGILKEQEAGVPAAELCQRHGIIDQMLSNGKQTYGGPGSLTPGASRSWRKRTDG